MGALPNANECEPEANDLDKRILYELTGIRLSGRDFNDESSQEEDVSVLIDNVIGYS